ncbi:MAG: filamentous hemagglutinin N-terminal domain-containing protein, partial [Paucibacter sp.]|nr:filamentous hemagglutinin N-terminal domain-containing protein [Roseateles sp.]
MNEHASINRLYRLIWSASTGTWVAVSEVSRGRGKRSIAGAGGFSALLATLKALPLLLALGFGCVQAAPAINIIPQGGQVVAGQASISTGAAQLNIHQSSQRAAIDWQSFNLGANAQVNFKQPNSASVILNRVLDAQPSQIFGRITSNGQVFLSNPAGIYFSPTASADVGALVATTHSISTADFMAGQTSFSRKGSIASVINAGSLTANLGGYIALLAPEVRNEGVIMAQGGTVALAAGEMIELQFSGARLSGLLVSPASVAALVDNRQAVLAPDGLILLTARGAQELRGGVIQQSGRLIANSLKDKGGRIVLEADAITLARGSAIDASGATGGGQVLVGGDWQGTGAMHQATSVRMAAGAKIDASAGQAGDGGKVVLWSDIHKPASLTQAQGEILAMGGVNSGHGGQVETSGHQLSVSGARVSTAAPRGKAGQWLLDPYNITIASSGASGTVYADSFTSASTSVLLASDIEAGLTNNNVSISTGAGGSDEGNINVAAPLSWSANKLTLSAHNNITIGANLNASNSASLALEFGRGSVAAGNTSSFTTTGGAAVNLPASSSNFTTLQGSDGALKNYTVITSLGVAGSTTSTDLQGMLGNRALNYALGANIDASSTASWNSTQGFAPVGDGGTSFSGRFDGLGHTISGLTIKRSSSTNIGLFGYTSGSASISNAGLLGGSVQGRDSVGMLVGRNSGKISNSYASDNTALFTASSRYAGGLVGYNDVNGQINNSYASGSVIASSSGLTFGGLVGNNRGTISNSYATGSVTGSSVVGGLVGNNSGTVSNSYASGIVTGSGGGLIGFGSSGTTSNSYWDISSTGRATSAGGTGLSAGQSTSQAAYSGFDFSTSWVIYEGQSRPLLRSFMTPLTVTIGDASKTYDGISVAGTPSLSYSLTPNANLMGSLSWPNASNAGTYAVGGSLYSDQQGYLISVVGGTLTVNPATLNLQGTRAYDGSSAFAGANLSAIGVNGETFSVSGAGQSGNLSSKNVQSHQPLASTAGLSLGSSSNGGLASNYTALSTAGSSVNITPLSVTVSGIAANHKAYDGLTSASLNNSAAVFTGMVAQDQLSVTSAGGVFTDKNAGSGKTVNISGITLGGTDAGNYILSHTTATATADINKAHLTVTADDQSRLYGGANPALTTSLSGFVNGESLATSGVSGNGSASTTATATTGVGSAVISASSGTLVASNYDFTNLVDGTLTIGKAHLTVTADDQSRLYGGANPALTTGLSGFVNGENLANSGVSGSGSASTTATATTGVGAAVISAGSGTLVAANYDFTNLVDGTLTIGKAHLTVTADDQSRLYGGTNPALTTSLSGFVNGESLASSGVSGSGSASTTLTASNYDFSNVLDGSLRIGKAPLTITADNKSRLYGAATPALTTVISGFVNGETLASSGLSGSAAVSTSAAPTTGAGSAAITPALGTLSASNYDVLYFVDGRLDILKAPLLVTANPLSKTYDGVAFAGGNGAVYSGWVNGENAAVLGGSLGFAGSSQGARNAGSYVLAPTGLSSANYLISYADAALEIGRASISAITGITAANKTYDGSSAASLASAGAAFTGMVAGDQLTVASASASFADKNAGKAKPVSIRGLSLGGADAGNYSLSPGASVASTLADIDPALILAVSGISADNKTYDGTTAVTLQFQQAVFSGKLAGDDLSVATANARFADKGAGSGKAVSINDITLGGSDAGNYLLQNTSASSQADIARALITAVSGITAENKIEDGSRAASLKFDQALLTGRIGTDLVGITQAQGSFDDALAGVQKTVTISEMALGGADALNYQLSATSATATADIDKRAPLSEPPQVLPPYSPPPPVTPPTPPQAPSNQGLVSQTV